MSTLIRESAIRKRHLRSRKKLVGTAERPRFSVHRSHKNLQAQIVDDYAEKTLISVSTLSPDFRKKTKYAGNVKAAQEFGKYAAELLKKKGIQKIVFDRGGFLYHGRIKALADALRESGVEF